ncbi:MAG: amidohydrolase family protein [Chthoniobacterales bacterium]|nr:amidohydrolase family protein [Chthoniobacterales bacterium]
MISLRALLSLSVIATATVVAQPSAPPAKQVTVIHAGELLDRPGQKPRGNSTILIEDGKITDVRDGFAPPPPAARVVDLRDQFVLPGLIDMHVHLYSEGDPLKGRLEGPRRDYEDSVLIAARHARITLEAGFTTVRDLGGVARGVATLRDFVNSGDLPGPTIVPAGRMISVASGHGDANNLNRQLTRAARDEMDNICNGADSCREAVRNQILQGAEVIKFAATGGVGSDVAGGLARQMFEDEMQAIVETARTFGRKTTAHAHGKDGIDAALRAGVDSIDHGSFIDDETIALFKERGAYLVPTMMAPIAALEQARRGDRPPASLVKAEEAAAAMIESHKRAYRAGVKVAFGTDSGVSKHGLNAQEFKLMVDAGMTPAAAIQAATVNAAELLGRSASLGTIERGKDADIIAVKGNPLDDVTRLENVGFVMRRGVVHKLGGQRQVFPHP